MLLGIKWGFNCAEADEDLILFTVYVSTKDWTIWDGLYYVNVQ